MLKFNDVKRIVPVENHHVKIETNTHIPQLTMQYISYGVWTDKQ